MKYFLFILTVALISQASAQLRCLICQNCENLTNQQPQVCTHGINTPPTLPTTAPPPVTTPPPGEITTVPTTVPTGPTLPSPPPTLTTSPPPTVNDPSPPVTLPTNPTPPSITPIPVVPLTGAGITLTPDVVDGAEEPLTTLATYRRRRDVEEIEPSAAHFSCFRVRVPTGTAGASVINRGCVRNGGSTSQTCLRSNNYVDNLTECQICSGDGCNSSSGLISSLFLIVSTIFIVLRIN